MRGVFKRGLVLLVGGREVLLGRALGPVGGRDGLLLLLLLLSRVEVSGRPLSSPCSLLIDVGGREVVLLRVVEVDGRELVSRGAVVEVGGREVELLREEEVEGREEEVEGQEEVLRALLGLTSIDSFVVELNFRLHTLIIRILHIMNYIIIIIIPFHLTQRYVSLT